SEFAEDASKAAAAYKDKGDLRIFDTYIDHVFYKDLGRSMIIESQSPDVKNIVAVDIDAYNILAVLRGKYWGLSAADIDELIVATTSKVSRETLQKMINIEKTSEAIAELGNTVYKDIIPQSATDDINLIMQLEAGFEALGLRRVVSAFRSMFSVGIMVAALKLMMIEVRNLAAIASGVEQGVPLESIMSNLIKPE
ncbi:MAG TPA: V-type ATPase subunit, partial [Nitrososphaera sp.]|nr:V-type ATPase subunit [Nitrososphaera sp.]